MHRHTMFRGRLAVILAATGLLAASGSEATAGGTGDADFDADAYCAASLALEDAPEPDVHFESATDDEIAAAARPYATDVLRPLADDIIAVAPAELAEVGEQFSAAVDQLAVDGDFSVFETPEMAAAFEQAHTFDLATCDWHVVEVAGVDYGFEGLPTELAAGPTSFEFTNAGEELHELVLFRKNDGVTATAVELLALPEDEVFTKITYVDSAFAAPGDRAYTVHDLNPGDYVAVCMIPVGTTSETVAASDAMPHAMHGMVAEFTVT